MTTTSGTIDARTTINDAIRLRPGTVAVFDRFGLDSCCGGALRIEEAARRHGLNPEEVLRALDAVDDG